MQVRAELEVYPSPIIRLPQPSLLCCAKHYGKGSDMAVINRRFYQSWRGPSPNDQDFLSLIFDSESRHLLVRHELQASRHNGVEDLEIAEFLQQTGSAQAALIDSLFLVSADA